MIHTKTNTKNGIADPPESRVLIELIKYVFTCFLNWHKVDSSLVLVD